MATFSDTGWLLLITLIKIAVVVFVMLTSIAYLTWLERKVVAHIQSRWGPYLVGYSGLIQPLADGLKFILKEDIVPLEVDTIVYWLAPFLATHFGLPLHCRDPVRGEVSRFTATPFSFPDY